MDSTENMAKLVLYYVMLFIYTADIVYLWWLQKSLKFAILVGKKSKICDFLHLGIHTMLSRLRSLGTLFIYVSKRTELAPNLS